MKQRPSQSIEQGGVAWSWGLRLNWQGQSLTVTHRTALGPSQNLSLNLTVLPNRQHRVHKVSVHPRGSHSHPLAVLGVEGTRMLGYQIQIYPRLINYIS